MALKGKNESVEHATMKADICEWFRNRSSAYHVATEVSVQGIGVVDVAVSFGDATAIFECGETSKEKIELLKENFDVVVHIPYCYTKRFISFDFNEIAHRLFVHAVTNKIDEDLDRNRVKIENFPDICLELGDCPPSRRTNFWEQAVKEVLG